MAIKIDPESIVRVIRPTNHKFYLDELNDHVEGFIEPVKIGPVWVMYDEKAKEKNLPENKVASFFFNVALYGTILIIPPQQLPEEWDIMDDEDRRYSSDDIDSGFLLSLQNALMHNRVFGTPGTYNIENLKDRFTPQEEYTYTPPHKDFIDENTPDFYQQVYDFITANPEQFKKNILLSSGTLLIKIEKEEDKERMLNQMIEYFVQQEEYEKCVILKSVL
jgi:hypothetical protein